MLTSVLLDASLRRNFIAAFVRRKPCLCLIVVSCTSFVSTEAHDNRIRAGGLFPVLHFPILAAAAVRGLSLDAHLPMPLCLSPARGRTAARRPRTSGPKIADLHYRFWRRSSRRFMVAAWGRGILRERSWHNAEPRIRLRSKSSTTACFGAAFAHKDEVLPLRGAALVATTGIARGWNPRGISWRTRGRNLSGVPQVPPAA